MATIDNGLSFGDGEHSAEAQIENLLASPRATTNSRRTAGQLPDYLAMAENYLWPSGKDNRRPPGGMWSSAPRPIPTWPWMPGARGLDTLKTRP